MMVAFKKMWEDVNSLLNKENLDLNIVEVFNSGFTVKENDDLVFVTREDFVDLWCNMLYYNKVSKKQVKDMKSSMTYVYDVVKRLPYICETADELTINV